MLLPQRLKQLRLDSDLTQEALAERLPANRGTYAHYELGKRQPDLETLIRIADFYHVSTDYLLGRTDFPAAVKDILVYFQKPDHEYPLSAELGSERVADADSGSGQHPARRTGQPNQRQRDGRSNRAR